MAGTGSIQLYIDGLTILIAPKPSLTYEAEKEKDETREKKLNKVKKLLEKERIVEKSELQLIDRFCRKKMKHKLNIYRDRIEPIRVKRYVLWKDCKLCHEKFRDSHTKYTRTIWGWLLQARASLFGRISHHLRRNKSNFSRLNKKKHEFLIFIIKIKDRWKRLEQFEIENKSRAHD